MEKVEPTKCCSTCGELKRLLVDFSIQRSASDGRKSQCKSCISAANRIYHQNTMDKKKAYRENNKEVIRIKAKRYREENKESLRVKYAAHRDKNRELINEKARLYREENRDRLREAARLRYAADREKYKAENKLNYNKHREKRLEAKKLYWEENKDELKTKKKKYYEENRETVIESVKAYYSKNREKRLADHKIYRGSPDSSSVRLDKLPPEDGAKMVDGFITVVCKMCGKRYTPTRGNILDRLEATEKKPGVEINFYCSDACKNACPLHGFHPHLQIDPRSSQYIPPSEAEADRKCQTDHLKQLQCDERGYNWCEKCGDIIDVELHHTQAVGSKDAVSSAGHMLLCAGCHVELHGDCRL